MPKDLTGMRYGKLTVLRITEQRHNNRVLWLCQCDCGTQAMMSSANLGRIICVPVACDACIMKSNLCVVCQKPFMPYKGQNVCGQQCKKERRKTLSHETYKHNKKRIRARQNERIKQLLKTTSGDLFRQKKRLRYQRNAAIIQAKRREWIESMTPDKLAEYKRRRKERDSKSHRNKQQKRSEQILSDVAAELARRSNGEQSK